MCWSAEASLAFFVVGWAVSGVLICRNAPMDRFWRFFFLWVTGMQFLEFLMWRDQRCGALNNAASQAAWVQNLAQPLVGLALALAYVQFSPGTRKVLVAVAVAYLACVVAWAATAKPFSKSLCAHAEEACGGSLRWPWARDFPKWVWGGYFAAFAVLVLATWKNRSARTMSIYLCATLAVAAAFAPFEKAMGSWWCVFAVGGPALKLAMG